MSELDNVEEEYEPKGVPIIFACKLPVYSGSETIPKASMFVKWEVYSNCFGRVKTLCFAKITMPDKSMKTMSTFACLHPDHPEEFDLKVGILKTFARLLSDMQDSKQIKSSIWCPGREWRKRMWRMFMRHFDSDWSYGAFSYKTSGDDGCYLFFYDVIPQIKDIVPEME